MFYKQPWSSISTDIINDKRPNGTRPKRVRVINRSICYSPLMVRRFDGDNCSKLHTCEKFKNNRIARSFLNASTSSSS
jgi:hypothetical protein